VTFLTFAHLKRKVWDVDITNVCFEVKSRPGTLARISLFGFF
jgi:hypothetical protein